MYPPSRPPLTHALAVPSKALNVLEFVAKLEVVSVYVPWFVTVVVFAKKSEGGCSETTANLFMNVPEESKSSPVLLSYVTILAAISATRRVSIKTLLSNLRRPPISMLDATSIPLSASVEINVPPDSMFETAEPRHR